MTFDETVTKILSRREILDKKKLKSSYCSLPVNGFNLSEYLETASEPVSRFGSRYCFVK